MMNLIRDLASICLAAVLSTGGHAATIQTDGSSGSVQARLSNAQSGDTVVIPNGTYHWTAPITVNTYVTLQGASVGGVTIIDDIPTNGDMITVNSSPNGNTAIANLIIIPGAINGASNQSYGLAVNAGGKPVLMHDCVFYTTNSNPYNYDVRWGMNGGVIWHCTFDSLGNYIAGIEFQNGRDAD
jgi:signal peptidase I